MALSQGTAADSAEAIRTLGRRMPIVLALSIMFLSLAATFGAWRMAEQEQLRHGNAEFGYQAREMIRSLEQRMATYEQVQRGVQALLLGDMDIPRDEYRHYIDSLRLQEKFPGIQGLAIVKKLQPEEVPAHVEQERANGSPAYRVHPEGPRELYSAITRIEPFSTMNLRAIGYDMLSEPNRRAAMLRARDTGQAAASAKVRLIQEDGRNPQPGLVMYMPVYRRGAPVATVEERRANHIGWVGAPFRMGDLMAGMGGERSRDIELAIYDGNAASEDQLLYRSHAPGAVAGEPLFALTRPIWVAGRVWTLQFRSTPSFEQRLNTGRPNIIAVVGVMTSLTFGLMVWILANGRRRAVALAQQMTVQLRESEFRWKYALEGAGDGVWDLDCQTGESVYSRRWKEMLGYSDEDIGHSIDDFNRILHPDDAPHVRALADAYLASNDPRALHAEFRLRCKDGSWKWILSRSMAVTRDVAGRPLRMIGTHTDITEARRQRDVLKEAYARIEAEQRRGKIILDHSHDAFVAVSSEGIVTDWNVKAERMFAIRAGEAIGQPLSSLIMPEESRAAHEAGFKRFVASGGTSAVRNVVEVQARDSTGRLFPAEVAFAGFPEADGFAVSAFIRDITERRAAQRRDDQRIAALEEARNALHHAQRLESVGKLTGGVAHDFNNVLHVIGGNIQLLQSMVSEDDTRIRKRLAAMQSAVDRGSKLSAHLLAFARRQPLQPVSLHPLKVLNAMEDLIQRALGEQVKLSIAGEGEIWNVMVDKGQLENVLVNLAINARDAMPEGGRLTITVNNAVLDEAATLAFPDIKPGDYVRMALTDTGVGMSPQVLAMAFEPFFTTKQMGKGTGLGLSMAYGFVKQSGGQIKLHSVEGQGTTVEFYLPRSITDEMRDEGPKDVPAEGGNETILVVEDDADVRTTVVSNLIDLGYRVVDAENGDHALALLQKGLHADLLFTDVVMPGKVSSTELAAEAKRLQPDIVVLYTSGYIQDALTSGGRLEEGVQLLSKPYKREQLAAKIRESLRRRTAA